MNYFQIIISQVGIFYFFWRKLRQIDLELNHCLPQVFCVLDIIPTNFNFLIFATLDLPMYSLTIQID